ncbi:MAG: GNAT family N-acetyltransferase, partial [Deltaproteobacteria bacterium]|nr:GNAT family N-acetyltransferase [Deltaproteobacteria bacterium]
VAFVVREDFQGMGICSYLLKLLEKIAMENGYTGFSATVLRENASMIHVFKKRYPDLKTSMLGGNNVGIIMDFNSTYSKKDSK